MNRLLTLIAVWICTMGGGYAQKVIEINAGESFVLGPGLEILLDSSNALTEEAVLSESFMPLESGLLNLGNFPYTVWARFSVSSRTEIAAFLEVQAPLLETIELYELLDGELVPLFKGGFLAPFGERPIRSENWLFSLDIQKGAPITFYLKARSGYPLLMPVQLSSKDSYAESAQGHNLFWGLYMGIMVFAILYNFFIFISVKERVYLYYITYIIGSVIFYLGLKGFSFQFLWPNLPVLNTFLPLLVSLTNILVILFALKFLNVTREQKVNYRLAMGFIVLFILIAGVSLTGNYPLADSLAQLVSLFVCIFYIYLGVESYRRGIKTAKYFLVAWTVFLLLAIVFILSIGGAIQSNAFTSNGIFIGHMAEVMLLSFALADRINILKQENEDKQHQIIYQLREKERIQLKANEELEYKVEQRTAELKEQRNKALHQKQRSDKLLLNILPEAVAEELKSTGQVKAQMIDSITVLFTDIVGFTILTEQMTSGELVDEIHECFSAFDEIMVRYGVEKIKTIGDSYMAAGGVPTPNDTHPYDVVQAAIEIREFMNELQIRKRKEGKTPFEIRIGIHTGPVVSGVVGANKFAYDIWGDTVNLASRMETSGEPGKINISESTYHLVKDKFQCVSRGEVEAKYKGKVKMYFVEGLVDTSANGRTDSVGQ